jgi:hypothetical protein
MRLRRNLPLYWRAFIWEKEYEGQAYNYTIAALKKRWQAMEAVHYGEKWVSGWRALLARARRLPLAAPRS